MQRKINQVLNFGTGTFYLFLLSLVFTACDNDKRGEEDHKTNSVTVNCVKIEREQIQSWVDNGWTKPESKDSLITKIIIQFDASADPSHGNQLSLVAFPARKIANPYAKGITFAKDSEDSCKLVLKDKYALGNTIVKLATLDLFEKDGSLKKDFKYLMLKPEMGKFGNYVYYTVTAVGVKDEQGNEKTANAEPCPNYCPDEE